MLARRETPHRTTWRNMAGVVNGFAKVPIVCWTPMKLEST